jgi:hypothetical protein
VSLYAAIPGPNISQQRAELDILSLDENTGAIFKDNQVSVFGAGVGKLFKGQHVISDYHDVNWQEEFRVRWHKDPVVLKSGDSYVLSRPAIYKVAPVEDPIAEMA